jgi:hypothetical protein
MSETQRAGEYNLLGEKSRKRRDGSSVVLSTREERAAHSATIDITMLNLPALCKGLKALAQPGELSTPARKIK